MKKRLHLLVLIIFILYVMPVSLSYAAEKEGFVKKVRNFWVTLLSYPARVTEESASVVTDTLKGGAGVITNGIKRASEVARGDVSKTSELITEPIIGTAETVMGAAEGIIKIPSEAAKEKVETVVDTQ
jgi:hypothetical protein